MAIDGGIAQYLENAGNVNHARGFRRFFNRMVNPYDVRTLGGLATSGALNGGVARSYDLSVVQRGAGANMSVDIGRGGCLVGGTVSADQGEYFVYNDATVNVVISAANVTNPRIDVIGVRVQDQEHGDGSDSATIAVVTGTPAGSPAVPTLPANFLTLAHVAVAANASSIVTGNITDKRTNLHVNVLSDATVAFTAIPSGPASDPTTANQLTRKSYVDGIRDRAVLVRQQLTIPTGSGISDGTQLTAGITVTDPGFNSYVWGHSTAALYTVGQTSAWSVWAMGMYVDNVLKDKLIVPFSLALQGVSAICLGVPLRSVSKTTGSNAVVKVIMNKLAGDGTLSTDGTAEYNSLMVYSCKQ